MIVAFAALPSLTNVENFEISAWHTNGISDFRPTTIQLGLVRFMTRPTGNYCKCAEHANIPLGPTNALNLENAENPSPGGISKSAARFHRQHLFRYGGQDQSWRVQSVLRRMIISSTPKPRNALTAGSGTDETVYRLAAVPKVVPEASVAAS
jgi:hypothetical protein